MNIFVPNRELEILHHVFFYSVIPSGLWIQIRIRSDPYSFGVSGSGSGGNIINNKNIKRLLNEYLRNSLKDDIIGDILLLRANL